ncbi:hypothetical protein MCOR14_010423 [Pyricularia oryzae]|nr:hypothetical protein MCOR14_010423 [Pyricularia oryzae]
MGIVANLVAAAGILSACSSNFATLASPCQPRGIPRAVTAQGTITGARDAHGNSVFLGIPFAATTGGDNRWRAPQPVVPSKEPFAAVAYGPTCPQAPSQGSASWSRQDEDCLNLNIWTPKSGDKLPVLVYMYGGAMVTGSSSNTGIQGTNFANKGVVYVNFNTRESIFASPHSSELAAANPDESQNFSILDVDKALEWVHDNIEAFGGDPNHIVFAGHSSGSLQVDHYLWNHPDTFLKGAAEMSANTMSGPAFAPADQGLDKMAAELGCPSAAAGGQIECLRKVDAEAFMTTQFSGFLNTVFTPVIDDKTRHSDYAARFAAGQYASHVPLLTGLSDGEGTIFSLVYGAENGNFSEWIRSFDADVAQLDPAVLEAAYPPADFASESLRSGALYGDARFNCPVDYYVDLRSEVQPTWAYRFFAKYDNVVGVPGTAPTHGTEVPFFHGGNECFAGLSGVTPAQQALADSIHDMFVAWIKDPAAGPGWDRVKPKAGPLVKLGVPGDELSRIPGETGEFNARCQAVYNPKFPEYPVVQSIL